MAKKKRRSGKRRSPRKANPSRKRSGAKRRSSYRRRRNPSSSGMGAALVAVLIGAVGVAAIGGGLGFQSTITGNWVGATCAGGGIALGAAVGAMGYPMAGVALAAAGSAVGLTQFATSEVAQYEANNSTAPQGAINGAPDRIPMSYYRDGGGFLGAINGVTDTMPMHSNAAVEAARNRLQALGMR